MKRLLVTGTVLVILAAGLATAVDKSYNPQPVKPDIVTVTKTTQLKPKTYSIGDTQDGVRLIGEYHTSYQNMRTANPTVNVVAFAVSGVSQDDLWQYSAINSDKGFTRIVQITVPECGDNPCAVFDITNPTQFYYKNLVWSL